MDEDIDEEKVLDREKFSEIADDMIKSVEATKRARYFFRAIVIALTLGTFIFTREPLVLMIALFAVL